MHPKAGAVAGIPAVRRIEDLPGVPDAAFIGVNRHVTIEAVRLLSERGAGGAVCFASGFLEAEAEDAAAGELQAALLEAAGEMPILGPNCYGFINYLDRVLLWPDQHGGRVVERGVAIITQSSNIALNMTMQARGVPLAYVVTAGNQAQVGVAEIGRALLADPRVTALGLHLEGVGDLRALEALAGEARRLGKRIVALKVGKSQQARAATVSHTASLAGGDAGAEALLRRLGMARVGSIPAFLEVLKLLHVTGGLASNRLASISCSGGEASLMADTGEGHGVVFPPLNGRQKADLRDVLGPMVALANPLDYHTYIWRDTEAMTRCFAAMVDDDLGMTLVVVDFPRADRCDPADWDCTIEAVIGARQRTGRPLGMVASLPELLPEGVAERLMAAGVVPFFGFDEALAACAAAAVEMPRGARPVCLPTETVSAEIVPEAEAKRRLQAHGLRVPKAARAASPQEAGAMAERMGFPVVLKGEGVAHKSEAGAVVLGLGDVQAVIEAARVMPCESFLVEEMVTGAVAELLIGVVKDPAHGFVLTLGAGGVLTEILKDSRSLLLPVTQDMIDAALDSLRMAPVLAGFRGKPGADREAIHAAIRAVEAYVLANADGLEEIEINPLLCTPEAAIAADALMRRKDT